MGWNEALLIGGLAFAVAVPLLAVWRRMLLRWQILDKPVARSSHVVPTPTGAGLVVMAVVVTTCLLLPAAAGPLALIAGIAAALSLVSWLDDIRHLPPALRLALHLAAVVLALWLTKPAFAGAGLPGPVWPWLVAAALAWAWFINLYNFMDGIDGMAGVESLSLGLGIAAVAGITGTPGVAGPALAVAGASLGFLVWNWHPAKLFLGDAGSIPLGFLLGWLLLSLALDGPWLAAVILPLYYLADATVTLLRRAWRREALWRPHREHFYQQAVQGGLSHRDVAVRVAACNGALIGAALGSIRYPVAAAIGAAALVLLLLWTLHRHGRGRAG